ncbi:MAG: hypothetical protein ABR887_05995 [Methanoregulaceae archaeon]|jgi:hypothetical protein
MNKQEMNTFFLVGGIIFVFIGLSAGFLSNSFQTELKSFLIGFVISMGFSFMIMSISFESNNKQFQELQKQYEKIWDLLNENQPPLR